MRIKINNYNITVFVFLFVIFSKAGFSQGSVISDTLLLNEISLDTVRFYLFEDLSKIENTIRDTAYITVDNKVYRIPYRISANTIIDYQKQYQNYKLTGISLYENAELESFVKELFRKPREKLKDKINAKDWNRSEIYLRYFEPYDQNSPNLRGSKRVTGYDESELEDEELAEENYENFPLPETIDLEVDLRKIPKVVSILGLEFDFDKLDKKFQKLLMGYGGLVKDQNRKSSVR